MSPVVVIYRPVLPLPLPVVHLPFRLLPLIVFFISVLKGRENWHFTKQEGVRCEASSRALYAGACLRLVCGNVGSLGAMFSLFPIE